MSQNCCCGNNDIGILSCKVVGYVIVPVENKNAENKNSKDKNSKDKNSNKCKCGKGCQCGSVVFGSVCKCGKDCKCASKSSQNGLGSSAIHGKDSLGSKSHCGCNC